MAKRSVGLPHKAAWAVTGVIFFFGNKRMVSQCLLSADLHDNRILKTPFVDTGLNLLAVWPAKNQQNDCDSPPPLIFSREFFVSHNPNRTTELEDAVLSTISSNSCAIFRFVISNRTWTRQLQLLQVKTNAIMEIYFAHTVLVAHLFHAATIKSSIGGGSGSMFVVSTADIAFPRLASVPFACSKAFQPARRAVLVMSRQDVVDVNCERYKNLGSFDAFMGVSELVTPQVLFALQVSPQYWGVENLAAFALAGSSSNVFNLCPYVSPHHHHASEDRGIHWRPRVNSFENSAVGSGDLSSVCELSQL